MPGDRACRQVNRELATIAGEVGSFCGTGIIMAEDRIIHLGDAAVPALVRALDGDGWVRPFFARVILHRMWHFDQVSAWCRAHTDDDNFPWVCQGVNPWSLLAGAGEL
jgi:hypothetical protein